MSSSTVSASYAVGVVVAMLDRFERYLPYAIGVGLFALPLLYPLGIGRDYPNQLARVFIDYHAGKDPLLASNYAVEPLVVPHLALDIFSFPLASWLSPYFIGSLFNGVTLVLLFTATLALSRRGSAVPTSAWPALAAVALFNENLHWGFMNFLFSCGLCLWVIYFWLESEHWPWRRRLLVFSVAQIGLFFCHLLGFLLCGYLILTLELARLWRDRQQPWRGRLTRLALSQLQFVVPVLLFGYVLFGQSGVGDDTTIYGVLAARAVTVLSPFSALGWLLAVALIVAVGGLFYLALRIFKAGFDPDLLPLIIALVILVVAMPVQFNGIWGLHFRYPFILLLLLIAGIRLRPGQRGNVFLGFAAVATAVTVLTTSASVFYSTERQTEEVRQALRLAEPGSALLIAAAYRPGCQKCLPEGRDQLHAGSLAIIERQMFVPTLFTGTSPVTAAPARHDLDIPSGFPIDRMALVRDRNLPLPKRGPAHDAGHPYWYSWDRNFDYLLWLSEKGETLDDIPGLQPIASGDVFILYRIVGTSDGAVTGDRPAALSQ